MMDSERALVPGSSGGLPAHIERRTRIANRVLGELERRDTEAFFRRHPEFFRLVVSRYYPLNEELIGRYADYWDWSWSGLSGNAALPWSEALIDRYAKHWNWRSLCSNEALPWSEAFFDRYAKRWDWEGGLSWSTALPWSEALIDRYAKRWDWRGLSQNAALPWSEALIDRYAERLGRWGLSQSEALLLEAFIDDLPPSSPLNEAFFNGHIKHWGWGSLKDNMASPWNETLKPDRHDKRWHWGFLSRNLALPWSEALIDRYAERWGWTYLSSNTALPWSEGPHRPLRQTLGTGEA
jgi:hypothetical protein